MLKMKSHFIALIGEEEFSLEAKAALEELTANMALIIKVITSKHICLSIFVCVCKLIISLVLNDFTRLEILKLFCLRFDLKYLLEMLFTNTFQCSQSIYSPITYS